MADQAFDAVIFDLDGTLVATDRFWPQAAREGAIAGLSELKLTRDLPTTAEWMSMVGLPLNEGFDEVFADLSEEQRRVLERHCVEAEERTLRRGGIALLPGVEQTLRELQRREVRTGIASNCHNSYLFAMWDGLGLRDWMDEARCLQSPGIRNKADMIQDLLETFGTRRAFMVGDRMGDRDSAWANGLPHVHLARGYAGLDERVECEAIIDGFDSLLPMMDRKAREMDELAHQLAVSAPGNIIGVTGCACSGKTLFAESLARALQSQGQTARVIAITEFLSERPELERAESDPLLYAASHVDFEALQQRLAELDEADAPIILEGAFLAHPAIRPKIDFLIHLDAPRAICLRRLAGRDGRLSGVASTQKTAFELLPLQEAFEKLLLPAEHADLVLTTANLLA
ncbi:MAG: phosphoglycolate phosphatase-like HAD superfamily hydrolase/cytidylate kinase [Planctomycetota bacterium]|jgi:phosphoglycolate phosphatase-like HAD superfamily hydrolase/cytidylate kinase